MPKCSYCGKENQDAAQRCFECGSTLRTDADALQTSAPEAYSPEARRKMLIGGLWCGGGLLITLVTFAAAYNGGSYVVAWGAILFGARRFYQGLALGKRRGPRAGDHTYLLNVAAQLESVDPDRAIAMYTEIIRLFPNSSASAEAQRNMQALCSTRAN